MNIIISNSSSVPLYEQITQAIKQAIFSNELKEDEMLPSVRGLANELKISFLTVKKAYDELEQEGFIKTVQGKGSFVAPKNLELLREEKLKEIQGYVEKIKDIALVALKDYVCRSSLGRCTGAIFVSFGQGKEKAPEQAQGSSLGLHASRLWRFLS